MKASTNHPAYQIAVIITGFILTLLSPVSAQIFKVDTILYNGPSEKRINLVYLGDGYTAGEMNKFQTDVQNINQLLLNTFPLNGYKNYFNVFAIEVISNQSGIKHANTATDCPSLTSHPVSNPDNYFGTRFDYGGIHRLVVPGNYALVNSVLANNFPLYDQALIVANTGFYGGSGGTYATATTNSYAAEIMIHEIGHSFAKLADEYWAGTQYAREMPNMTAQNNPSLVRWKNWLGTPQINIFPHSGNASWFKPSSGTCKMEALSIPFCSVCSENFIERIHFLTEPIESYSPVNTSPLPRSGAITFKVNTLVPTPNTLKRTWQLNGITISQNTDSVQINANSLTSSSHTVQYSVSDSTLFSKDDNHPSLHTYNIIWNISAITGIEEPTLIETAVRLYPNPVKDQLNVALTLNKPAKLSFRLVTLDGQTLYLQKAGNYTKGTHPFNLDLSKINDVGNIMVLQIMLNENTITREVIRIR
jgi:hypothetical protein